MSNRMMNLKKLAQEASLQSTSKYHRHGAVVIRNGRAIATGYNNFKLHAEVNAVLTLRRVLWGQTKVCTRY